MKRRRRQAFGLIAVAAAAIVLLGALGASSNVQAQTEELALSSTSVQEGEQVKLELEALGMTFPGLGAWTVDITYDPSVVSTLTCVPDNGSVCNPNFTGNTIRVVGATGTGLQVDAALASITFRCDRTGSTTLGVLIREFEDATPDDPQPIDPVVQNGQITCLAAAPALLGDVNCDGVVNSIDAAIVLQLEAGLLSSVPCPENADLNGDGLINSLDAAIILQIDAGLL